ncbi:MAG: hypothetical protein K6B54_04150 [Clostridia bacterium]|nr:hypothetical protein [Clostridia bacterium]
MNFKKLIACVLSLVCLAAVIPLAGCNGGKTGGNGSETDAPKATEVPEPTPAPRDIGDETTLASSIVYAADLLNGIQGFYDSPDRDGFTVQNLTSRFAITLKGGSERGLTSIMNANGVPLLTGGITGYVKTADGFVFGTTSSSNGRVNTNKMGIYYYEVNIRDLAFDTIGSTGDVYEIVSPVNFGSMDVKGNNIKDISVTSDAVTFKTETGNDPYLVANGKQSLSGANSIVFDLTVTGNATSGELFYIYDGGTGYTQDQKRRFKFDADNKTHTISVYIPDFDGYNGNLRGIRFDIDGAGEDDLVKIENVRLAKAPSVPSVKYGFEQTLHSYSDKMHCENRILYDAQVENLAEFGERYVIPKSSVEKLIMGLEGGTVLNEIANATENFEYIGFDIKDAGVIGVIAENDGVTKTRVYTEGDSYVVEIYIDISGKHKKDTDSSFGHRLYADGRHTFDELQKEAYFERNPLAIEVTEQYSKQSKVKAVGYDTNTGAYSLTLNGTDFSTAYGKKNRNNYYGGTVKVSASGDDRRIYFLTNGNNGCLEAAALLDDKMMLVPIEPEVCKNFAGEHEEGYYDPKDTQYGVTVYPLYVSAGNDITYTFLNLYQNWGANALKQISSISFHIGYYHLSTGVTESNCIAPYFVYGRDGWTLPDFRGCSGIMWDSQPQFNSVGRPGFISYKDGKKVYQSEYTDSEIRSVGPVYSDLDYSYVTYDGAIEYSLRHVEFPQNDENRTYYTIEMTVLKDVTYTDARENFTLFYFDPRFQCMETTKYKAEDGSIVELKNNTKKTQSEEIYKLAKENPYFSLYNYHVASGTNDVENFGFIVKSFEMTVGGKPFGGCLVMRNSVIKDGALLNKVEIGVDADTLAFKKGDTMKFVFILLPFGVADQKDDHNVDYVIEDSIVNPWRVLSVTTGEAVYDDYIAVVNCENNVAEFTVTGGRNANAVRVNGFTKLVRPKIQELVNGEWVDYVYNVKEFDGYQVNYSLDGYFDYSFIVNQENFTDTRTFRVTAE